MTISKACHLLRKPETQETLLSISYIMSDKDTINSSSHRQILRTTTTFGSATAIKILIGLLKIKFVAILLGPVGIGLLGLYESLMTMVATLMGMGLSNSGVRQIAGSSSNNNETATVRGVLWYASIFLGIVALVGMWAFRDVLAIWIFNDESYAENTGYLGVAVLLAIFSGAQMAVLQGLRQIGNMARASIVSSIIGLLVSLPIIWFLRDEGIVWYLVAGHAVTIIVTSIYIKKLSLTLPGITEVVRGSAHLKTMLILGVTFMVTQFITEATRLVVRSLIVNDLGLEASGQFQAVWAISMTYMGFVITTMTADYYPRLTGAIHDNQRANRIVCEQTEAALLLAGPLILLMQAFAPWVIRLLYSADFMSSVEILRWLILGDAVRLLAWPLGFVLIAKGKWQLFFITQLIWNLAYLLVVWFGLQELGLLVTGLGYVFCYLLVFGLNTVIVNQVSGFRWSMANVIMGVTVCALCLLIQGLAMWSPEVAMITGMLITAVFGWFCLKRLVHLSGLNDDLLQFGERRKAILDFFANRKMGNKS